MARKRIVRDVVELHSWTDVDANLKEIATHELQINEIEGELNSQINELKEKAQARVNVHKERIEELEKPIEKFVVKNKLELDGKSKTLTFGTTGFRKSTSVTVPRGDSQKEAMLQSLKAFGMTDCIKIEESINKDVLKKYPEADIVKVGAKLKTQDTFWYETNYENLN